MKLSIKLPREAGHLKNVPEVQKWVKECEATLNDPVVLDEIERQIIDAVIDRLHTSISVLALDEDDEIWVGGMTEWRFN